MKSSTKLFIFISLLSVSLWAARGPAHKSLRAYSMGNAHVAVVDDKEAIYYNYAGLSQINRLGNFSFRPQQGYYPRQYFNARVNIGGAGPFMALMDSYKTINDIQNLYNQASRDAKKSGISTYDALIDSLAKHPEHTKTLNTYDQVLLNLIAKFDAELAFRNFGGAIWVDANLAPYIDTGLLMPYLGIDTLYVDAVAQAGVAYAFTDQFSLGLGLKILKRQSVSVFKLDAFNYSAIEDTLKLRYKDAKKDIFNFSTFSLGTDIGALFQITRETRIGASIRDIFFKSINGESIAPNLTLGVNYSPRLFNKNTSFARKVNLAIDFEDALNNERNYKFFNHLNFGGEIEQTLLGWLGVNNEIRALKGRLAVGFKGGYPTAGLGLELLRILEVEVATWAEERGYYLGQLPNRFYMGQVRIGF